MVDNLNSFVHANPVLLRLIESLEIESIPIEALLSHLLFDDINYQTHFDLTTDLVNTRREYEKCLRQDRADCSPDGTINEVRLTDLKLGIIHNYHISSSFRLNYRWCIINKYKLINDHVHNALLNYSSFMLFDDDVYDLQDDILNGKQSILKQFISSGLELDKAIDLMLSTLPRRSDIQCKFAYILAKTYTDS